MILYDSHPICLQRQLKAQQDVVAAAEARAASNSHAALHASEMDARVEALAAQARSFWISGLDTAASYRFAVTSAMCDWLYACFIVCLLRLWWLALIR